MVPSSLMARRRLDHVDAMRPVKQAGVLSTHTVLYLAPAAASLSSGAALLLLHAGGETAQRARTGILVRAVSLRANSGPETSQG